jgi:hypothetical protein
MIAKLRDWLLRIWRSHLQFTLGLFTAAAGILEYVDAATINVVGTFFGPKYGLIVSRALQAVAGLLIAYRARQVSRPPLAPPPVP